MLYAFWHLQLSVLSSKFDYFFIQTGGICVNLTRLYSSSSANRGCTTDEIRHVMSRHVTLRNVRNPTSSPSGCSFCDGKPPTVQRYIDAYTLMSTAISIVRFYFSVSPSPNVPWREFSSHSTRCLQSYEYDSRGSGQIAAYETTIHKCRLHAPAKSRTFDAPLIPDAQRPRSFRNRRRQGFRRVARTTKLVVESAVSSAMHCCTVQRIYNAASQSAPWGFVGATCFELILREWNGK